MLAAKKRIGGLEEESLWTSGSLRKLGAHRQFAVKIQPLVRDYHPFKRAEAPSRSKIKFENWAVPSLRRT